MVIPFVCDELPVGSGTTRTIGLSAMDEVLLTSGGAYKHSIAWSLTTFGAGGSLLRTSLCKDQNMMSTDVRIG